MTTRALALLSLAFILLPFTSNAEVAQPAEATAFTVAPFTATPDQLRAAAAARPAKAGAPATILYEELNYKIAADRTLRFTHRWIYRIDSQEGVQNWAGSSMQWDPWYQKPAEIQARVMLPAGDFVELDQKTITDAAINSDEDETYTSARVRKAPLPGFTIGSIVEEETATEDKRPFNTSGSSYRIAFSTNEPVGLEKVTVELPASMPFKDEIEFLPGLWIQRTEQGGIRHVTYEQADLPASVQSDIDLVTSVAPNPSVEFSTGLSWAATATEYASISDPSLTGDATMQAAVRAMLPADLSDRAATIRELVQRMHKEVRYTGVEFDQAQWVPGSPTETLKRHYGDCKDKAALLVTLLRAAKIPAYLVLLDAGPGRDVRPDMPALNIFNHAIVFLPADHGSKPLWIDATASYSEIGILPYGDAGRLALIIAPGTTALTRTPDPTPESSVAIETREFNLPDFGRSTVTESSETHGYIDSNYRSLYGGAISEQTHKNLESYIHSVYLAKELKAVDHTDGADLGKPFQLKISVEDARRGETSLIDAAVGIFPMGTLNELPSWFGKTPEADNGTDEQKKRLADAVAHRSATYNIAPFIAEQRFLIHVPPGFVLRAPPPDKTTPVGPGKLIETYHLDSPTLMRASLRFTTGKSQLTAAEVLAMRDDVLALSKRSAIIVTFDEVGMKLLADGKPREAMDAERAAIKLQPKSALPHVHYAQALLKLGVGDEAHKEAALAATLQPDFYVTQANLGWVLEHNDMGVRFGIGFQRDAAVAAYRKAVTLHPESENYLFDLAILEEFDSHGVRYADPSGVAAAIKDYRTLIEKNPESDSLAQYQDNELFALVLTGKFSEVDAMLSKLPTTVNRGAIGIASAVAQHGVAAALAHSEGSTQAAGERSSQLAVAGNLLARMQLYPEAAEVLKAGMAGQEDVPAIARQIELYQTLKKSPETFPSGNDPADPIRTMFLASVTYQMTPELASKLSCRNAYLSERQWQRNLDKNRDSNGMLTRIAESTNSIESVLRDLMMGNQKLTYTGDDENGYAVVMQSLGASPSSFYIAREDGRYCAVAEGPDHYETGAFTLYLLDHKRYAAARALLKWSRDLVERENGDDALAGPMFPRFWKTSTSVADATPDAMRLAAISLIAWSPDVKPQVPFVVAALAAVKPDAPHAEQRRTDLELLLATCYVTTGQADAALEAANALLKEEPDSNTAIRLAGLAFALRKDYAGWSAMLTPRLAAKPADHDLLNLESTMLASKGDYKAARVAVHKSLEGGHATAGDYNGFAWLGLFSNDLGADTTDAAQQGNMLSKNGSFAILHTMASIYAAQGKITEAREVLLQAMTAANMGTPDSSVWYVIGLMDKQLGLNDAALAALRKVDAPEGAGIVEPTATWILAQREISSLGGVSSGAQTAANVSPR